MSGLTHVALRGEAGQAEYTDRVPALQARYWYRSLGPLNPMTGVEYDLITAAERMYGQTTPSPDESANLQLDSAYAFSELARVTGKPETRRDALILAFDVLKDVRTSKEFDSREASYQLQTAILEQDLRHDALRLNHTGSLEPKPLDIKTYRQFEKDFAKEELRGIDSFAKLVHDGITDKNFGILFESFFIMARRHKAWQDEEIDTVAVRGASSRENAEWTGEYDINPNRITGNHDVVVATSQSEGRVKQERFQLKTVKGRTTYHPRVTVLDFQEVINQRFGSIDGATRELLRKLGTIHRDYVESLA